MEMSNIDEQPAWESVAVLKGKVENHVKRTGIPASDIITLYYSVVRSVLEYGGCLQTNLTADQSASLRDVQKRAEQLCKRELESLGDWRINQLRSLMQAMHTYAAITSAK